ncbi:MAG: aerobic carbon-monoxide dehydrogenase large subunit [Solirubrobacteraceae bacterium]|nr:aerobic carbon-monoxide dehydrogenase large subunit [Solirubrobacteraceae bacterium]
MTATTETASVGRAIPRVEDRPLLTGSGRFVDDVERAGQVHVRIVRSEVAHGRIRAIATGRAAAAPGVVAVVTGADIPDLRIPVRMMPSEEAVPATQPPLAREIVRYVGEPVAAVVATDPYLAEDAAGQVEVDIEPRPALVDTLEAAAVGAAPLHAGAPSGNVVNRQRAHHGEDVDALLAGAHAVVSERLRVQRHAAIPLETRGLVAEPDAATGRLTVWGPTKVKHFNRTILAGFLGMREEDIRFLEPDVGGGFGGRGEFYPEDFLVPWLALRLGRAAKWVEDRREHFVALNHTRETWCDLEMGSDADGRLLAFRARCWVDHGAYARTHGTMLMPWVILTHLAGPYTWRGFEIDTASVLTNKTPSGTYRGPGMFEAAFFRERMVDRLAAAAGADPAELRARSVVALDAMPHRIAMGHGHAAIVYDGGDFPHVLATLTARTAGLRRDVARRRRRGELVGAGVAAYVEAAAFGRYEYARVVPQDDGRFVAYVGVASLGQGVRTALAQIAADELGVEMDRVEVVHNDTDLVPQGFGAYASRATVIGGGAVVGAADDLWAKAFDAAAERLEISPVDLERAPGGVVRPRGHPTRGIALAELDCEGSCRFDNGAPSFDMGATLAVVAVDPDTGAVAVTRLVVCHDVGRAVNPLLVEGQLVGAAAQGLGGTLLEELAYGDDGQPLATSFMDYLMPTAAEVPPIDAIVLELPHHDPATAHPLHVKGAGEAGIIGVGAAIANAVADALGPRGGPLCTLPLTPDAILSRARPAGAPRNATSEATA